MSARREAKIKWHGGAFTESLKRKMRPRLKRAGSELRRYVILKVSAGKTRTQGPSKPGDPPHKDIGHLSRNIYSELLGDGLTVRVFTTVGYGRCLEEGTRRMAARPYLRPSLAEMRGRIVKILAGQYKKG